MNRKLEMILYSSMSFTAAVAMQYFQSKAQYFYVTELKMSPSVYSLALAIWAIYNSINDPLAGLFMDRKPTRWGRRIPWIVIFVVPLAISYGFLWAVPSAVYRNETILFIWLVTSLLVFDTGYTVVILAWAALFPEMYKSSQDRSAVSAIRQVFSIVALVVALVIPPNFVHDNDIASYGRFGWVLALLVVVNVFISLAGCREVHASEGPEISEYSIEEGISILKTNRDYQAFLFVNMVTYFAYGQLLSMLPFYRNFVLGQDEQFESAAYGSALGVTLLALAFWVWVTNTRGSKVTFVYSAIFFSVMLIPLWFLDDVTSIIIVIGVVGFGLAGLLMIVDILLSEIVDKDFEETGKRREGIYFGFNGFFIRISILLQAGSFALISYLTGFDKDKEVQTELGKTGIKIQMLVLPIIMLFLGIFIIMKYYSLGGQKAEQE